ncbi:MAG: TIGR03546 family protein [Planctomycetota bacterium]|nr:MAG: TIGR03546 family protein [Planctomycetota bacterium]
MPIVKQLRKLVRLMLSETAPASIAVGLAAGTFLGLPPLLAAHTLLVVLLVLVFRTNLSATLCSAGLCKLLSLPLAEALHRLGASLLRADGLRGFWTSLLAVPGAPWFRFNDSLVLGSLLAAALLSPFAFALGFWGTRWLRRVLTERRQQHWLAKLLLRSRIFLRIADWSGEAL